MISDAPLIFIQVCTSVRVAPGFVVARINAFASLWIGRGDRRCDMVGPEVGDDILDRRERNGFAGDLGEALGAALDRDEALLVDRHDVAGVVPAAWRGFELARIVGPIIADHDVRAPHDQPAALVDAGHGLEARLDERQEPADRPDFC